MHDPLVVDQHAVGHRIVVADDGIDELVHEGVGLEFECFRRVWHHRRQERGAGHVGVLRKPRLETGGDTGGLRHSADAGRMLHHALALGNGKLAEQKERFARSGGDPIGIAAARIQERRLRGFRGLLGEIDELILDLERAERFEFPQREERRP